MVKKHLKSKKDYEKIIGKWFSELTMINFHYLKKLGVKEPFVKATVDATLTSFLFIKPRVIEAIHTQKDKSCFTTQ